MAFTIRRTIIERRRSCDFMNRIQHNGGSLVRMRGRGLCTLAVWVAAIILVIGSRNGPPFGQNFSAAISGGARRHRRGDTGSDDYRQEYGEQVDPDSGQERERRL